MGLSSLAESVEEGEGAADAFHDAAATSLGSSSSISAILVRDESEVEAVEFTRWGWGGAT